MESSLPVSTTKVCQDRNSKIRPSVCADERSNKTCHCNRHTKIYEENYESIQHLTTLNRKPSLAQIEQWWVGHSTTKTSGSVTLSGTHRRNGGHTCLVSMPRLPSNVFSAKSLHWPTFLLNWTVRAMEIFVQNIGYFWCINKTVKAVSLNALTLSLLDSLRVRLRNKLRRKIRQKGLKDDIPDFALHTMIGFFCGFCFVRLTSK